MGDMETGFVGSTPLGLMVAIGEKSQKSDVHSTVASQLGISRDSVKTLVYGVIYGLGLKGATEGLMQNLLTSFEECEKLAREFLNVFKGIKSQVTRKYFAGLASESFNAMEVIADSKQPATPLLGNRLTKSLAGNKDFKPTRVNWVIQTSGVDFRDMLLLYTEYFYHKLGVRGRLLMTIHDEIRTQVRTEDEVTACHALQLAHLYTWAAFTDKLGLNGIPAGGAWFSSLDIDKVLRKEPVQAYRKDGSKDGNAGCVTPSQPIAVPDAYGLTPKQLLDILQPTPKVKQLQTV